MRPAYGGVSQIHVAGRGRKLALFRAFHRPVQPLHIRRLFPNISVLPSLALFRTFAPAGPAVRARIGFVWHHRTRLQNGVGAKLGLFSAVAPTCRVGLAPPTPLCGCRLALFRTFGRTGARCRDPNWLCFAPLDLVAGWSRSQIGFVSHDGPQPPLTSNIKLHTSNFFLSHTPPLIAAVLHESDRKNGWRHQQKSL